MLKLSGLDSIVFDLFNKSSNDYMFLYNIKEDHCKWSDNAVRDFDMPYEWKGEPFRYWCELLHPEEKIDFISKIEEFIQGKRIILEEKVRVYNRKGYHALLKISGTIYKDENGIPEFFAGILVDTRNRNKIDITTNILSIHEFHAELEDLIKLDKTSGVLLLGIDNFKRINELYNYSFGNNVLQAFAHELLVHVPEGSSLYRLDGDKFAMIHPNYTKKEDLEEIYDKAQEIAKYAFRMKETPLSFTISGGAVLFPDHGQDVDTLYKNANCAMETSKSFGKSKLTYFSNELIEKSLRKKHLIEALRYCIDHNFLGFELNYQPLSQAKSGELFGCEALLRWSHKDYKNVRPEEFIPILEESLDIIPVGKWVLTTALEQAKEWHKSFPHLIMNVNVSYLQFKDKEFRKYVVDEIERIHFPTGNLVLELTESCKITDVQGLKAEFEFFRSHGISIALDDFGTGYASVSILRDLPMDWVKIDHTFVARILKSEVDKKVIEHLINLCRSVNSIICVEGIETKEICDMVNEFNPNTLQGNYFNCPISSSKFYESYLEGM